MTRQVTLPAGVVSFAPKVRYDIELDWDYAYLTVNGTPVATCLSTNTDPNGQNFGNGITGSSGRPLFVVALRQVIPAWSWYC